MKILQVLPEMNVGGVERGVLDLAKYLVKQGHESLVVSHGGSMVEALEAQGTKHYTLAVHKKDLFSMWECSGELEKIILKEGVDIVHARSRVPAWIAYFSCRRTNAAFVTTCHGYYSKNIFSHVMGWGKLVIVISEIIGRHMIEDFRVHPENIRLIHRSVDLDKFKFRERRVGQSAFTVSMVGRITPLKGHAFFLEAMAKVIRQMPYVRVRIIGDAPANKRVYKDRLVLLTRRLGISEKVEFLGNRADIPQLLEESDVLVLSTITHEAFGRVIVEAQAVGVPVVVTKVGGVVDIVEHEKTGLVVLPRDVDAMASAVMRIIKEPKLADAMILEARKRVEEKYTLEQMATATIKVYQELKTSLNILVIKLSAVGDVILATAALRALRKKYPQAKICCLVGRDGAAMIQGCPYVDEVITYDYKGRDKGVFGFKRMLGVLRKYRFDKIIDFQNNNRSHLLSFLCFPRASYGYRNKKLGCLLSHGILNDQPNIPPVRHQFRLLEQLDIVYDEDVRLEMWPRPDDILYAKELLHGNWIDEKNHTVVGVNISASERWPTKNLPMKSVADLCDKMSADNIRVIITGMEKDASLVRQLSGHLKSKPAIFVGKTNLLQLAALISLCKVYVTSDSAPLHVAAAMDVPVVAFFGPTNPERHIPPASRLKVIKKDLACQACYLTECKNKKHACMVDITSVEVYAEIKKFLGKAKT
ncbi:MAG: glycosyltransferase [Candidatus Omnitrophica bacterium]|nr:glycosyltransferase [Candidatus Omnitrophota bacterium]